jgi:hypothetical protein
MKTPYKLRMFPILAALLLTASCAPPIPPEVMEHADYGPYPKNYQAIIKHDFTPLLIDPTSPLYTYTKPVKMARRGNPPTFGWRVCGTVNSKNRMGGYSGASQFYALIRDGQVVDQLIGDPTDDNPITNGMVEGFCE